MYPLYRHRHDILWANSELLLLHGHASLFRSIAIESLLGSQEWFSKALGINNFRISAIGQAGLNGSGARLNWLLSLDKSENNPLLQLIDQINLEAGLRGARFITAGARVEDCLFELLRRAGFCIYSWQSIWEICGYETERAMQAAHAWRRATSADIHEIVALQRQLLAPSVQSVSEFANSHLPAFVLQGEGRLQGYADIKKFNSVVLIKPIFKNSVADSKDFLLGLALSLSDTTNRILIMQTSDQAWLTKSLNEIGHQILPREELLVKHFAALEKLPLERFNHAKNGQRVDTITPLMSSKKKDKIYHFLTYK